METNFRFANSEAEAAVIGGILTDFNGYADVASLLTPDDFYYAENKGAYRAIQEMATHHSHLDAFLLGEYIAAKTGADYDKITRYLMELQMNSCGIANIVHYGKLVKKKAVHRLLIAAGNRMRELPAEIDDPVELLGQAQSLLDAIADVQQKQDTVHISVAMYKLAEKIEETERLGTTITGLATGFDELDEMTTGLHPGELIVVSGRPAMGKSAIGMGIAEHVSFVLKKKVLVASAEMPEEQLALRTAASQGNINAQNLRRGDMGADNWDRFQVALGKAVDSGLYINASSDINIYQLRAMVAEQKRKVGIDLLVVDYLQLLKSAKESGGNRNLEIMEISNGLKAIAKQFDIPVIALAQLNRDLEKRSDKRPINSDLRDSGSIEQDADVILHLYRDEVYNPDTEDYGVAEVIIGKQRNGPIGTVRLSFVHEQTKFVNFDLQLQQRQRETRPQPAAGGADNKYF